MKLLINFNRCIGLTILLAAFLSLQCSPRKDADVKQIDKETCKVDHSAPYHGIDVSHHNGAINWEKVAKNKNIKFVYIKATEGATHLDSKYREFFDGAKKVGLKTGSYHYFRMTSTPRAQFENIKRNIDKDRQDLIPMIDVETTDGHSVKETRDSLRVLLRMVEKYYGKKPVIYGTNSSYNKICGNTFNNHPLYLGRYGKNPPVIKGREHYTIWQYSENGKIDGITKPVDLCRFHPDYNLDKILY